MIPMPQDVMPQRVRAALNFIYHCKEITDPDEEGKGRELEPAEKRVHQLALDVLARYFAGEMDYGDRPPRGAESEASGPLLY